MSLTHHLYSLHMIQMKKVMMLLKSGHLLERFAILSIEKLKKSHFFISTIIESMTFKLNLNLS